MVQGAKARNLILLVGLIWFGSVGSVSAQLGPKAGIHILHPSETNDAAQLLGSLTNDSWRYITVPFSLKELDKTQEWQSFFASAASLKLIPVVRLVTQFENGHWTTPTRKNIVDQLTFLSQFTWPTAERYVIIYNEPNHAPEYGGEVDPVHYAQILRFASDWAKTESKNYKILPAGLDLAAPNGRLTMEAFDFLTKMHQTDPDIFETLDYWTSHSYPNPGFISPPYQTGKNSIRGYQYELALIKKLSGREFQVFITETGWLSNSLTNRWLESYYLYTAKHIWSDDRVKAVTPFLLHGSPGTFSGFSFLDATNQPTRHYNAYQKVI